MATSHAPRSASTSGAHRATVSANVAGMYSHPLTSTDALPRNATGKVVRAGLHI
jgi:hypothetical protein